MEDKILVCIPSYNAEETITATIQSVLNQSKVNFKILVVDNASTDKTVEIVRQLQDDDNLKKIELVVNDSNIGRIQNWNKCLELFLRRDFSYLKFLFTGDILKDGALSLLLSGFTHGDRVGLVAGGYDYVRGNIRKTKTFDIERQLTSDEGLMFFVKQGNWVGPPLSCMFSKEAVTGEHFDVGFDFASDYRFYVNIARKFNAVCLTEIVGDFSSLNRKHFQKYKSNLLAVFEELHTRYVALGKLENLSAAERDELTKFLNIESLKILIIKISVLDSLFVITYKIKMSFRSLLFRMRNE